LKHIYLIIAKATAKIERRSDAAAIRLAAHDPSFGPINSRVAQIVRRRPHSEVLDRQKEG
jgi:hypothetical protein